MKIKELFPDVISEDQNFEYKSVLNPDNPIKWAKTIVGYANSDGGVIFVGVSDDGEAFGLDLGAVDQTKNLISKVNDRHIFPHAKISYVLRNVDAEAEHFVLGVKVAPADSVVRYRDGDFNEKVFVRGDGNSTPATPEEIIALSRRKSGVDNETTDIAYKESDWTEYLDLCRTYRDDKGIPTEKELENEEILSADGYAKSGFLMFRDHYEWDDTLICSRLWTGKDKTGTVLDNDRFRGSLAEVFTNAINFIERNTKSGWEKTSNGGRKEVRSYPKEAIREALVNAIAHRDYSITGTQIDIDIYSDRIEIVSPGSWLLPKPYDAYPVGSIPSIRRNTVIAACLDVANLMERGGTGFQTMVRAYQDAPEKMQPVVTIYPGFLNLKLYDRLYSEDNVTVSEPLESDDKEIVVEVLRRQGPKSVRELQNMLKYENRGTFLRNVINPLINDGIIYRDGNVRSPKALIRIKG